MRALPALCLPGLLALAAPAAPVDFSKDVEPLLRTSCLPCHAGERAQAGLRLDSRSGALKGGVSGPAVTPGNSTRSRLMERVTGLGGKPRMPMGGKPLSAGQIAILKQWIDQGAHWPERDAAAAVRVEKHWAYVKPARPALPAVRDAAWVRNPIDRFVLARLEKEGLRPSPEAGRETLIRRLSLDLTGLPPAIAEIDEFLADSSPQAYDKVVERLLASPHYGEKWARPWLDLARYADTNGYEKDRRRSIWKYRDWVIDALNRDLPFDEFTIEQIAGDMLPSPTREQWIATGFHRNTMFNEEGGVDKEEAHWENLVDRVNTTATVWLGSTLACAQCHDHKYDPFTQKEYYQLMAFFNNTDRTVRDYGDTSQKFIEPQLDLATPEQEERRRTIQAEIDALEARRKTHTAALAAEQSGWERGLREASGDWAPLEVLKVSSSGGSTLKKLEDGSILAAGINPARDEYVIEARSPGAGLTALRLEALPHESLPRGGPGRDAYGNFFVTSIEVEEGSPGGTVRFLKTAADDGRIEDKRLRQLWGVDASREEKRLPRQLVLPAEGRFGSGGLLRIRIRQFSEFGGQGLGHFRLSATRSENPKRIVGIPARLRPVAEIPAAARTEEQKSELAEYFRSTAPSLEPVRERLAELRKELDSLGIASTLIVREAASHERPSATIRLRGVFTSRGETVHAAVPGVLHALPEDVMPNRLGLARWLVSRENPLTARVTVNRIWEQYFGRGLVETSEDFGRQGSPPTHPELLDWLANELMDKKWSLKAIHRLIAGSATYRQSSNVSPALLERDPYNKLLARGPRFRLEAEAIRDTALAAGGLLSDKIGGPSVFPPQPEGIWDLPYNDDQWEESGGEDRYRRGLYTFWRRTAPYPAFLTFDATSREFCTVRRARTNTPLQALTALNDPAFVEAARALAKRILKEAGPDARARAEYGFRLCVARRPNAGESGRLVEAYRKEVEFFQRRPEEAARLGGDPELAAWTVLSNVLLNLDETLTKE